MQKVARGLLAFGGLRGQRIRRYHTRECFGHWRKSLQASHDGEWTAQSCKVVSDTHSKGVGDLSINYASTIIVYTRNELSYSIYTNYMYVCVL